jgi:hypothetical protein
MISIIVWSGRRDRQGASKVVGGGGAIYSVKQLYYTRWNLSLSLCALSTVSPLMYSSYAPPPLSLPLVFSLEDTTALGIHTRTQCLNIRKEKTIYRFEKEEGKGRIRVIYTCSYFPSSFLFLVIAAIIALPTPLPSSA